MRKTICLQKRNERKRKKYKKAKLAEPGLLLGAWHGHSSSGREGWPNGLLACRYSTSVCLSNFQLGRKGAVRKFV